MQNVTLLSTARTSRQQTSTSTVPLSDKELRVWDLLRSGHELGQGEPPDSWAENKQTKKNNPHLKWTYSQNFTYSVFMHESWSLIAIILLAKVKPEKLCFYLFLSLQGVMSHPWCRRQQQYHGWALLKLCLLHLAVPAWCCMLTSSRLHPALMSAGLPTDVTSEIPGEKYLRNMLSFVTLWYTTIHHPVSTNISC